MSLLIPPSFPILPSVQGVQLSTGAAGIKYKERPDIVLAVVPQDSTVGAVFTQSLCPSAPVDWCRKIIPRGTGRALVCNSGNANAFTGSAGEATVMLTAEVVAASLGIATEEVFLASTGVIGEIMPDEVLVGALPQLVDSLKGSEPDGWEAAANAMLTTDTFPKGASAKIDTTDAVVVGIAKGSGMIAPDMATMLAFIFTDLAIAAPVLQQAVSACVETSFNAITVDSDTSTSDAVLVFSTAAAKSLPVTRTKDPIYRHFTDALDDVMIDLAHQIVRDGEGATKFVEVTVLGAEDSAAAKSVANSVANSPLVKTALAGEDANWGRIVMAVGKSGQLADRDKLKIWIGDELTAEQGVQAQSYTEARATEHLRKDEVRITVDIGVGSGSATVWTCDLTSGYIDINSGYRS